MSSFINMFHAELVRAIRKRTYWGVVVGGLAMIVMAVAMEAGTQSEAIADGHQTVIGASDQVSALALTIFLFSSIVGILIGTGDYRTNVMNRMLRISPPDPIIAAKGMTAAFIGIIAGGAAVAVTVITGTLALKNQGYGFELSTPLWEYVARHILHAGLGGIWGAALGFLLKSPVLAICVQVAYQTLLENQVVNSVPSVGRFLPGGAESAIVGDAMFSARLAFLPGVLLFLGWALVLAIAGRRAALVRKAR